MSDLIPWDTLLLLLILDAAIAWALSVFLGVLVARAVQASPVTGALVGLLVLVGPLVWFLRELRRDPALLRVGRSTPRGLPVLAAAAASLVATGLLLAGMFLPWVRAEGHALSYDLAVEGSAAETGVGMVAVVGTAAVLLAATLAALFSTGRGRAGALVALAGALWLTVALDVWVVVEAAGDVASLAKSTSEGGASASVEMGGALWLTLAAAAAMFVSATALALHREPEVGLATAAPGPGHQPAASSWGAPPYGGQVADRPGIDYGDGF